MLSPLGANAYSYFPWVVMSIAYLLVSHGSHDPRHRQGLMRLAQGVRHHLRDRTCVGRQGQPLPPPESPRTWPPSLTPSPLHPEVAAAPAPVCHYPMPLVGTATLEATARPLAEQVVMFGRRVAALGVGQVVVVPLFLLAGVHVMEDLPEAIAQAQAQLPETLVQMTSHLGSWPGVWALVGAQLTQGGAESRLVVAHGSRRPEGNRTVEETASRLGAAVAYWAMAPGLETQVMARIAAGDRQVAIAPYFLFAGGITDAIIQQVADLAQRHPEITLQVLPPLGDHPALAQVISTAALESLAPALTCT